MVLLRLHSGRFRGQLLLQLVDHLLLGFQRAVQLLHFQRLLVVGGLNHVARRRQLRNVILQRCHLRDTTLQAPVESIRLLALGVQCELQLLETLAVLIELMLVTLDFLVLLRNDLLTALDLVLNVTLVWMFCLQSLDFLCNALNQFISGGNGSRFLRFLMATRILDRSRSFMRRLLSRPGILSISVQWVRTEAGVEPLTFSAAC